MIICLFILLSFYNLLGFHHEYGKRDLLKMKDTYV
jgi:hypothetical protein